jgi:hypothetical protein
MMDLNGISRKSGDYPGIFPVEAAGCSAVGVIA